MDMTFFTMICCEFWIVCLKRPKINKKRPGWPIKIIFVPSWHYWTETTASVTRSGNLLDFGHFLKPLAAIYLPKSPTFLGIFVKVSKSIIFIVKSLLGNFYWHLAIFFWSHWLPPISSRERNQRQPEVNVTNKFHQIGAFTHTSQTCGQSYKAHCDCKLRR